MGPCARPPPSPLRAAPRAAYSGAPPPRRAGLGAFLLLVRQCPDSIIPGSCIADDVLLDFAGEISRHLVAVGLGIGFQSPAHGLLNARDLTGTDIRLAERLLVRNDLLDPM